MIIKLQKGGTAIPPLVSYQPVMVSSDGTEGAAISSASSKSSSDSDLTDKDLMKMMEKLEGLPSDMQTVTDMLQNFYLDQQYSPFPNTTNIASRYLQALQLMRTANFNRKVFDDAKTLVEKNGGINEIAVDSRGYVFCTNSEGDFQLLRPEQVTESGYTPVTNSELLRLRAYSPQLANNNKILEVVGNGIGMSTITDHLNTVIKGLGKNEGEEDQFVKTSSKEIINGLRAFKEAAQKAQSQGNYDGSIDNLYKAKFINSGQANQAQAAMIYLYRTLPENAKAILKMKSKSHDDAGALDLMSQLVSSQITSVNKFQLSVDTPNVKTNADGTKATTGTAGALKLDPVALLQAGYGQKQTITIQTAEGGMNGLQIPTVRMPIVSKEGKAMGVGTLNDVAESGFGGYLDFGNATMGGVRIDPTGFQNVAVDGTALYTAYLPIDLEEYQNTGNIRPDIDSLRRLKEAQKEIASQNIKDKDKINEIYQAHSLPVMFDGNGDVVGAYKKFGIINGSAIQQAFMEDAQFADYLSETTDENAIKNVLSIIQKGRSKEDRIQFDEKSFWNSLGIGSYDHVYKGTIFIPVNDDYFTYSAASGESLTPGQAADIEARQQAKERERQANANYVDPGTL